MKVTMVVELMVLAMCFDVDFDEEVGDIDVEVRGELGP